VAKWIDPNFSLLEVLVATSMRRSRLKNLWRILCESCSSSDLLDISGHVLKPIWQGFGIADIVLAGHDADDFKRRFVHTEVEFAPGPVFPDTVLTDFLPAFAVNFDAGQVYNQVDGFGQILDRQGDRQSPPP
jgi:hypothetical protein